MARKSPTVKWLDHLFSTQGLRGPVLTLLSGAGIVMVIGYLALGVISRLYLPAEIGIGKYFVTMLTLVGAVASLRYEDALMLPRKDEDAAVLIWLSAAVMLLTAVLLTVLAIWSTEIAHFLDFPGDRPLFTTRAPDTCMYAVGQDSGVLAGTQAGLQTHKCGPCKPDRFHGGWPYRRRRTADKRQRGRAYRRVHFWACYCQRLFYLACLPS